MNDPRDPWQRLVRAAKPAIEKDDHAPPPKPAVGQLRQAVHAMMLTLTWRKWSLIVALLAGLVAVFVLLHDQEGEAEPRPLIEPEPTLSEEPS